MVAPLPTSHSVVDAVLGRDQTRDHARGRTTRELLIRTAERLFAQRGIHAVSLREIGQAAGQRNNGATQYHFGTRENLLVAIYVFRAAPMNARRHDLLEQLVQEDRLDDLDALLRAILVPHVESLREPDNHFVGYLARVLTDEADLRIVSDEGVLAHLDALRALERHVRAQCAALTDRQFDARYATAFSWAIHSLAEFQRSRPKATRAAIDAMFDDLVAMLAGALRAPVPTSGKPAKSRVRSSK